MSATAVITRYPKSVLTLLVLVTAVAMALAQRVRFENAIETWFVANDPALVAYNQFTKHFAADEIIVLAFDGDVFSPGAFALIDRLERRAAKAPYVHRVISLLDFDLDPPAPRQPESRAAEPDWDARRRAAAQNTLVTPMFVSADRRTTGLVLEISRSGNTVEGKRALVTALDAIVEDEQARSGIRILMTGTPVLDHRVFVTNERDLFSLYPFIVPVIFVICLFVFGRIADALIPLMVVGIAITWAYGLMGACGIRSTLLTSAMIPLLLAIGVADSVHVLSDYRRRAEQLPRTAAIVASVARTWRPCLFTTLTTVAGLLALLVSSLQPIREFGAMAAFGVLVSFFATMTLVPALLCVLGGGAHPAVAAARPAPAWAGTCGLPQTTPLWVEYGWQAYAGIFGRPG